VKEADIGGKIAPKLLSILGAAAAYFNVVNNNLTVESIHFIIPIFTS
jgi:hypothetical protein